MFSLLATAARGICGGRPAKAGTTVPFPSLLLYDVCRWPEEAMSTATAATNMNSMPPSKT